MELILGLPWQILSFLSTLVLHCTYHHHRYWHLWSFGIILNPINNNHRPCLTGLLFSLAIGVLITIPPFSLVRLFTLLSNLRPCVGAANRGIAYLGPGRFVPVPILYPSSQLFGIELHPLVVTIWRTASFLSAIYVCSFGPVHGQFLTRQV